MLKFVSLILLSLFVATVQTSAQNYPTQFSKISRLEGGLHADIDNGAVFGILSSPVGDLDNDGVIDVAVGATNQGGVGRGSLFIILLKDDGSVKSSVEILPFEPGNFSFGSSTVPLGDIDGDGVEDLGVGSNYDSDGGGGTRGSFWIIFLNMNGTVKSRQKISATQGGFNETLNPNSTFGTGATNLGDLDGDGVIDLAIGAFGHGIDAGVVYILFMKSNGTVKSTKKITQGTGGLSFESDGYFGYGLSSIGDLDGDGVVDLAVGGHRMDDGGVDRGSIWIFFLKPSGDVKGFSKISATSGNFNQPGSDRLGVAIAGIGDHDGDNIPDMIVAGNDNSNTGAIWYLMMNRNGTVKSAHKISGTTTGSNLLLDANDFFGGSLGFLGTDIDHDGIKDIMVGAFLDDDGGTDSGAIWISINKCPKSDAGPDRGFCSTQVIQLNAATPQIGSGQ